MNHFKSILTVIFFFVGILTITVSSMDKLTKSREKNDPNNVILQCIDRKSFLCLHSYCIRNISINRNSVLSGFYGKLLQSMVEGCSTDELPVILMPNRDCQALEKTLEVLHDPSRNHHFTTSTVLRKMSPHSICAVIENINFLNIPNTRIDLMHAIWTLKNLREYVLWNWEQIPFDVIDDFLPMTDFNEGKVPSLIKKLATMNKIHVLRFPGKQNRKESWFMSRNVKTHYHQYNILKFTFVYIDQNNRNLKDGILTVDIAGTVKDLHLLFQDFINKKILPVFGSAYLHFRYLRPHYSQFPDLAMQLHSKEYRQKQKFINSL